MSDEKMSAAEMEDVNLPGGTVAAIVTATKPRDAPATMFDAHWFYCHPRNSRDAAFTHRASICMSPEPQRLVRIDFGGRRHRRGDYRRAVPKRQSIK